jgi:hypothetical protein
MSSRFFGIVFLVLSAACQSSPNSGGSFDQSSNVPMCDAARARARAAGRRVYLARETIYPVGPIASADAVPRPTSIGRRGSITLEFVVDSTGRVDPSSIQVMHSTHADFEPVIRRFLTTRSRYLPAEIEEGRRVAQCVQQTFVFD